MASPFPARQGREGRLSKPLYFCASKLCVPLPEPFFCKASGLHTYHFLGNEKECFKTFMAEKLKIISLGGLNEIGKNLTVYEYGGDMIIDRNSFV